MTTYRGENTVAYPWSQCFVFHLIVRIFPISILEVGLLLGAVRWSTYR